MRSGIWKTFAMALRFALVIRVQSARGSLGEKDGPRVTGVGGFFFKAQHPAKLADWLAFIGESRSSQRPKAKTRRTFTCLSGAKRNIQTGMA
jgi:hypothetical protein